MDSESNHQFESRKVDHIRLSLSDQNQARGLSGLDQIELIHEALPDLDFSDLDIATSSLGQSLKTPFLISSMTAGHAGSPALNRRLIAAAEARGWAIGVGSQRRELNDRAAADEWRSIRRDHAGAVVFGNLGIAQLIHTPTDQVRRLTDALGAAGLFVHLNALQECLQPEGTPEFRGGLDAIARLCRELGLPVIVKETGCGLSAATARRLTDAGVSAIDVSGLGGTHWGRIEGGRAAGRDSVRADAAETFGEWGISTARALRDAVDAGVPEAWASGGIRSGLDAAKCLAVGARLVGVAKPILAGAVESDLALDQVMRQFEFELRTALFCTGCRTVDELRTRKVWQWR